MIKAFIFDEHHVVREGIKWVISAHDDIEVVGDSCDVDLTRDILTCRNGFFGDTTVVIADIHQPSCSSADLVSCLHSGSPALLVFTDKQNTHLAVGNLSRGVHGYMSKHSDLSDLPRAVRNIAAGKTHVCSIIQESLISHLTRKRALPHESLTSREMQIMLLIAAGQSPARIAATLNISKKTADTHRLNILDKMGMQNAQELTYYAIRNGLIT
jgi:DNA-binding NarL/FixJ family response regulator